MHEVKEENAVPAMPTQMERHLQTIIVLILTGLLVWVGTTVQQTQVEVAKLSVELQGVNSELIRDDKEMSACEMRMEVIEEQLTQIQAELTRLNADHDR